MTVVKLLPAIIFGLLIWVWICGIIGAASSATGWAHGKNGDFGWKKGTIKLQHQNHHLTLEGSLKTGGNAAIAGSVFAIIFSILLMGLAIARVFELGPQLLHFVGAGLSFLLAFIWMVCWATWADKTSDKRDDFNMDPAFAFAFAIIGTLSTVVVGLLFLLSRWKDCAIVGSSNYSQY
ncbi:hypothetical protein QOT17_010210 [Balamuthia mandrillaris]